VLGGSGSVIGAAIGALAIMTIDNGLILVGTSDFVRQFVQGAAIVAAVVVDALLQKRIATMQHRSRLSAAP
jgi:rhamnose transport system permease protein